MKKLLFIFLLTLGLSSYAQDTYIFDSGLVASMCYQYGREALFYDQFAYQMNQGTLQKPAKDQVLFTNKMNLDVKWQSIMADTDKKFKGFPLASGYLYLSYQSDKEKNALLHVINNNMVYVNGEPRGGDLYGSENMYLPVKLKKGLNEFYVRGGRFSVRAGISAKLIFNTQPVTLNIDDPTLPIAVVGRDNTQLRAAVIVMNTSNSLLKDLSITSAIGDKIVTSEIPEIPALSVRKVGFILDASSINTKGKSACELSLIQGKRLLDKKEIQIETVHPGDDYSETFISKIDGSTQYYSVSPQKGGEKANPSLYLSVHGAGVEAINQARAYQSKEEGPVVCATNRRPRGFNWEDWGRIDAMEVLDIAKSKFQPDPSRIYLTGHSMGGHGTWFLGATYAGSWAAIAPCAGYPTMSSYGSADGLIPPKGKSEMEDILLQASNSGDVFELIKNYNAGGVYIFHGDSDRVVSVKYAQNMKERLSAFTKDLSYYEYPGGSHWFGDHSVDWKPLFDYFNWHTIPNDTLVSEINFTTANPAVSAKHFWTAILQQEESLKYSRLNLRRSDDYKKINGTTENISILSFSLSGTKTNDIVSITLDGKPTLSYTVKNENETIFLKKGINWELITSPDWTSVKGIVRNGTFKEPFNNSMVFVYGTTGTKEENEWAFAKARYDAENWLYRGNGAVDIISDKEFSLSEYADRGVILFGNATTNKAWKLLLSDCPIQISRSSAKIGEKTYQGNDIAGYFMWPRHDSKIASVAVVTGTGIEGMRAADANQYFSGGSGFPDYMIFSSKLLINGASEIKAAGFYDNNWKLK